MYLCRTLGELLRMHSGCFCFRSNNVWFWKEQVLVSKLMKQRTPTACRSQKRATCNNDLRAPNRKSFSWGQNQVDPMPWNWLKLQPKTRHMHTGVGWNIHGNTVTTDGSSACPSPRFTQKQLIFHRPLKFAAPWLCHYIMPSAGQCLVSTPRIHTTGCGHVKHKRNETHAISGNMPLSLISYPHGWRLDEPWDCEAA